MEQNNELNKTKQFGVGICEEAELHLVVAETLEKKCKLRVCITTFFRYK